MSFKAATRGNRLFFVPGALAVPAEHTEGVQDAIVPEDTAGIEFVKDWSKVPVPGAAPAAPALAEATEKLRAATNEFRDVIAAEGGLPSAIDEVPSRSERRKGR